MLANSYAQRDDAFNLGIDPRAFEARARSVGTGVGGAITAQDVDVATGRIRLKGHGYSPLDAIKFEVTAGGALPTELAGFSFNQATPLPTNDFDVFRVATVLGGSTPIASFTGPNGGLGTGWSVLRDAGRRLDMNLVSASRRLDEKLVGHDPPLLPDPQTGLYPGVVVWVVAVTAALSTVATLAFENAEARVAIDVLTKLRAEADATLATWLAGKNILGATDQNQIPDNAMRAESDRSAVRWETGRL